MLPFLFSYKFDQINVSDTVLINGAPEGSRFFLIWRKRLNDLMRATMRYVPKCIS